MYSTVHIVSQVITRIDVGASVADDIEGAAGLIARGIDGGSEPVEDYERGQATRRRHQKRKGTD